MNSAFLPEYLLKSYKQNRKAIRQRLEQFSLVSVDDYFYEMCFCMCTPQSKAKNAFEVEKILRTNKFLSLDFNPAPVLADPNHYIRFHNQKSLNLILLKENYQNIKKVITSDLEPIEKREWLVGNVRGYGYKEASHFLRNIGCRGLAILDRHILKHLVICGVFDAIPKVSDRKHYLETESQFLNFADEIKIAIDELDLLFWSYESGEILK